jgi:hypothetical protein
MLKFEIILLIIGGIFFISHTNGLLFHHTPKCEISVFKGGKDFSGEKIMANKSFVPYLKSIGAVAKACKVKVHVIDSFKQLKTPDEFVLSSQMPLALGRGIHFDLQDPKGGTVCNKLCMVSRSWKTLPDATCFINGIKKKGIQFTEPNLLDDGYTAKSPSTDVKALKEATQKLCAPKTKAPKG